MTGIQASQTGTVNPDYGPRRLTVELTNICNLHCSYCLRDEDALYHTPANFLPVDGWHFERVWPLLVEHRQAVTHVSFSLDGATRETHDRWRGDGSFARLVRAFSRCWANQFPFNVKVGIRRDTVPHLEAIALFAARMGATGLSFAHIMPTSVDVADVSALTLEERADAEREIALLARIFKLRIGIDVGYYNTDAAAPCSALIGVSANINYRGHLSLCCNLSGFRGGKSDEDIIANLNEEDFSTALPRLQQIAADQAAHRVRELSALRAADKQANLATGSPCLFCLHTLGKTPWSTLARAESAVTNGRSLPVLS